MRLSFSDSYAQPVSEWPRNERGVYAQGEFAVRREYYLGAVAES